MGLLVTIRSHPHCGLLSPPLYQVEQYSTHCNMKYYWIYSSWISHVHLCYAFIEDLAEKVA